MASPARSRWILAIVLIAGIAVTWWIRRRPPQYAQAYVGERSVTVWSSSAQVREIVATLTYGDKVLVLRDAGEQSEIRTPAGAQGWVDSHLLITPEMWRKLTEMAVNARGMPVQAVGHTRALANVHVEPNRDAARIFQFGANVPLVVLDRRDVPPPGSAAAAAAAAPPTPSSAAAPERRDAKPAAEPDARQEDWLLVLRAEPAGAAAVPPAAGPAASTVSLPAGASPAAGESANAAPKPAGAAPQRSDLPIAGWVLARFVELDPPAPIPDYASAADMRVVARVTLNSVDDASGPKPQYMLAGTRGPDTPGCDFTSFRAFTWDAKRQRYETAYIANDLCGHLPILVQQASGGTDFRFPDPGGEPQESAGGETRERVYRMKQTVVRPLRLDDAGEPAGHKIRATRPPRAASRRKGIWP